jgi:hypothetical protein
VKENQEYRKNYAIRCNLIGCVITLLADTAMNNEEFERFSAIKVAIFEYLEQPSISIPLIHEYARTERIEELIQLFSLYAADEDR